MSMDGEVLKSKNVTQGNVDLANSRNESHGIYTYLQRKIQSNREKE